jgi:hypothetical protein
MPHAITEAMSVDETYTDAAQAAAAAIGATRRSGRQHEAETPNERAMRAAMAARKIHEEKKRPKG